MDPIIFDRFTMGFALSVHIILAVIGVVLPVIILLAEYLSIRYNDRDYELLAKRLTKAFIVLFAVGTASGMLVAVALVFIWPTFMALVGQVAILSVYTEVFAFFLESIFLALYVYSADIFGGKYVRVAMMGVVAIGAAASAALITVLNAFMNTPVGFNIPVYLSTGQVTDINPIAIFSSPAVGIEVWHVLSTSYFVGAGIFLAYFAYRMLHANTPKLKRYYTKALKLVFAIALISIVFAVITGILSIEALYHIQPEKFAAIELDLNSTAYAPELIGGFLINGTVKYALSIPDLQSILSTGSPSGVVPGLNQYPQSTWPPLIIHFMFDVMFFAAIAIGLFLLIVLIAYLRNRRILENKKVLWLFLIIGVLSVILLENGWLVDELGRIPWIIYNVMTITQAGNASMSIIPIAAIIVILYAIMLPLTVWVLMRMFKKDDLSRALR